MAIPVMLIYFIRLRRDIPFPNLFWMFGLFIIGCGGTHLMGALLFFQPYYNTALIINVFTAVISWTTLIQLAYTLPEAIQMKTPQEIQDMTLHLMLQERKYYTVLDFIREAIVTTDDEGIIMDCNKATEEMFGYEAHDLIGKSKMKIIPVNLREAFFQKNKEYEQEEGPHFVGNMLELDAIHKDGHAIPVELSFSQIVTESNTIYITIIRNLTVRRKMENRIKLLHQSLELRLKASEALVFQLLHDLNAPLRIIEGMSEIMLEDYSADLKPAAQDYLKRIYDASLRQRRLIKEMVRLTSVTFPNIKVNKTTVNLSQICDIILTNFKMAEPHRKVDIYVQPNMYVVGDKEFLEMAMMNMLDNAWKFTQKKDQAKIEVGCFKKDELDVYYIKDNGAGFDMVKVDKLFKPFSRLHDKAEFDGNGIGLSIVKQIITLHDGDVWAEGKVGEGATFFFTIGKKHAANT